MTAETVAAVGPPTLVVAEVFGPTVQGEGPSAGRRAGFIRLMGCNLGCSWCDSAFTWDSSRYELRGQATRTPVADIVTRAMAGNPGLVVITGGEPLLHQSQAGWLPLLSALTEAGADIEIETNGTQAPDLVTIDRVTRFNVSPKLAHAGDPEAARIRPLALRALDATGKAVFKFVCRGPDDVAEAACIAEAVGILAHRVWIMPEGVTVAAITSGLGQLADAAVAAGFNVTTRLHVLAWGDERGR